jgi:MinD-like ATPase involved in chromosome partitioning or flagellar assembly/Tfp pilus assembly protein PilF
LCSLDSPAFKELCEKNPESAGRLLKVVRGLIRLNSTNETESEYSRGGTGKIVSFFSAKGGVGKTFIAANFSAIAATRVGLSVALIELDLQFGNLDCFLGVVPARNLYQIAFQDDVNKLHPQMLKGFAEEPLPGLHAFFRPREVFDADIVSAELVTTIITKLQEVTDLVVIDCKSGFDDVILTALDLSDKVFVVATADFGGVVATQSLVKMLVKLGYSADKIQLLLNRLNPKRDVSIGKKKELFDGIPFCTFQEEPKIFEALNEGQLWAFASPGHPINLELEKLAASFSKPNQKKSMVDLQPERDTLVQKWLSWLGGTAPALIPAAASQAGGVLRTRSASASFALGHANYLVGKYAMAKDSFLSATETAPKLDEPWYYLGRIAGFDEDTSLARWYFEKAVEAEPDRLRNKVQLALVDCQKDELGVVLPLITKRLKNSRGHADVQLMSALVQNALGYTDEALIRVNEAISINNGYVEALTFQGSFYRNSDKKRESLISLGTALQANPAFPPAWYELGLTYCDLQLYAEAKKAFTSILDLYPEHRPSHKMLVAVQEAINVLHDEVRQYGEASRLHPAFGDLSFELGVSFYQLGRFQESMAQLEQAEVNGFDHTRISGLKRLIDIVKPLVVSKVSGEPVELMIGSLQK